VLNLSQFFDPSGADAKPKNKISWLRSTLEETRKMKNKSRVVFEHNRWFNNEADEADQYFNISAQRQKEYVDLLKQYGV
jgi:hypothetical protein